MIVPRTASSRDMPTSFDRKINLECRASGRSRSTRSTNEPPVGEAAAPHGIAQNNRRGEEATEHYAAHRCKSDCIDGPT